MLPVSRYWFKKLEIIPASWHKNKMRLIQTRFMVDQLYLKGELCLPDTPDPPLVVGSHGLEGSRFSAKQQVLSRLLPKNGIAFFRFDHRACGDSQGDFVTDTSLEKRTEDFLAAVTHVRNMNLTSARLGVFGSSMGGATCINAWQILEKTLGKLFGGVLCAAPLKSRTIHNIPTQGTKTRPDLPVSFFKENLLFDLTDKARALHHVLVFHGDADDIVPVENAAVLLKNMQYPKHAVIQKNGDHAMSSPLHQAEFEAQALAWFRRMFLQSDTA
jgi:alpha-beta hydrolase superfamily lysophospholipase